jgi:hypothetical protein
MQEIKIVRLNTGEDIIASIYGGENEGGYIISEPMTIDFRTRGQNSAVVMGYWLPTQLTEVNEVFMRIENIMCMMTPNKEFLEYYNNSLDKLKRIKDIENSVESMPEDEATETLLAVEDLESGVHVIH